MVISDVCVAFIGACHDCCQLLLLPVVVVATIIGLVEAVKYGRQRWEPVFFIKNRVYIIIYMKDYD